MLEIRSLLDIGCKTVANMIKGKTPEEFRKTFNIENDFTPEEEDQIRRENEWAEGSYILTFRGHEIFFSSDHSFFSLFLAAVVFEIYLRLMKGRS